MAKKPETQNGEAAALFGLIAEYESEEGVLAAARSIRDAGYTRWDVHTPFPVHGLGEAMGLRPTVLPWLVFVAGVCGCLGALVMQYWTNAVDYPFLISGKPLFSLPANIPVTFEVTILVSAIVCFLGVFALNRLPRLHHPVFRSERFRRASDDRFFVVVESGDAKFDRHATSELLAGAGAVGVEDCEEPVEDSRLPRSLVLGLIVLTCVAAIPPILVARARVVTSESPGLHLIPDMDDQARYEAQERSALFADGRSMRPPVAGAVARGALPDEAYLTGREGDAWVSRAPVPVDENVIERGQQRFDVFCSPCHGLAGYGNGPVATKAEELQQGVWVPPMSLHADPIRQQTDGEIFRTITNGIRSMPGYAAQIPTADRWAIVLYVRALERSQKATVDDVPEAEREGLRER